MGHQRQVCRGIRLRVRSAVASGIVAVVLTTLISAQSVAEPLGVRRNFLGMHNLKGGGVTPFQIGLDWTKTLVGNGFAMEWVTDFAPDAPDHWIYEVMARGMVPCIRVQHCQGTYPSCGPSVGYSVTVADQILAWKVRNPQFADRLVYLQLWNEPGDSRDYVPMTAYADFLVAAYNGIRNKINQYAAAYPHLGLDGTILVMTPGQNAGWDVAFNHNPQAKFSFDVWATHPYPDMTPPWYNIHDGDWPSYWLKCIDSYIQDLDECAKTHRGVPGRRGFPVMITETCYGHFVGDSDIGWPKLTQEARAPFTVDAFFERWYKWPEIIAVHPFLLNNVGWPAFEFVRSWASQDVEAPFGVLEPAFPYPVYAQLKVARQDHDARGRLGPARLTPYRGPVGRIRGTVTRADNNEVVPYATLRTTGYEYGHLSLYDGIYEIHNIPVGTYTLTCEKANYVPSARQVTVTEGQTTTADFRLTFTGRAMHLLYHVKDSDGGCSGTCANLNAVDHWQAFVTGPETRYIKIAACHIAGDGVTMKFFLTENGPNGPQVGTPIYVTNPATAGHQMIGWEWEDGKEPVVQPNTTYWLHFQRADGAPIYCYASSANPYPQGNSSSSSGVDFYGCIYGLTGEINLETGTMAGTVKTGSGQPIAGATVARNPGNQTVTTQTDGSYAMGGVPVGIYAVTASKAGYTSVTVTDRPVNRDTTTTVDFVLSLATPTPTPVSTPAIQNPSFEATLGTEWRKWVGSGSNQDNNERHYLNPGAVDGVWALAVKGIGTGGKGACQYIPDGWLENHRYRVSVYVKSIVNSNINYSIGYTLGDGGTAGASATYGDTVVRPSDWAQASVVFTYTGSAGVTLFLRAVNDGHSERAGFDQVQITDLGAPEPTSTATPTATRTPTSTRTPTRTPTAAPADLDGDSVPDILEGNPPAVGQTHRWLPDSDGDGLSDGEEDANRDGQRNPGETDARNRDTDGDSLMDGIEVRILGTNPLSATQPASYTDIDRDGLPTPHDLFDTLPDADGDRFTDGYEAAVLHVNAAYNVIVVPPLGDLNLDGSITNVDALAAHALFLSLATPGDGVFQGLGYRNADLSRDGQITNVDALMAQTFFLRLGEIVLP